MTETRTRTRRAARADVPAMATVLADAFSDDPIMGWVVPDTERRRTALPRLFDLLSATFFEHDETYITEDRTGAALWTPPGVMPVSPEDEETFGARIGEVLGDDAQRAFVILELMEQHHPDEPSFYLGFVGVRRDAQGRGIGSELLSSVLDRPDVATTPAYLEATSERNRRLYERHGFEVIGEIALPDGPSLWPMWRRPRR